MSKRANVFYIEHAKVIVKNGVVVFIKGDSQNGYLTFNIPDKNTCFLLLGKGTSITDAAMRKLSESNVNVGFCGSGGTPLVSATDINFLYSNIVESPTKYIQTYLKNWFDEDIKLEMCKEFLLQRLHITSSSWGDNEYLVDRNIIIDKLIVERVIDKIHKAENIKTLMAHEAAVCKLLYKYLAVGYKLPWFKREHVITEIGTIQDKINTYLTYGNYLAYGYASVVLNTLGLNHAFALLHGTTRREALVFDIADLIKDAYVMPFCFNYNISKKSNNDTFRNDLISYLQKEKILDTMFLTFINIINKPYKSNS